MKRKISVYGFVSESENDFQNELLYIGLDTSKKQDRIQDHLKPSKINDQPINKWLQECESAYGFLICEAWTHEDDAKAVGHIIESYFIKKHQPKFNKNSK